MASTTICTNIASTPPKGSVHYVLTHRVHYVLNMDTVVRSHIVCSNSGTLGTSSNEPVLPVSHPAGLRVESSEYGGDELPVSVVGGAVVGVAASHGDGEPLDLLSLRGLVSRSARHTRCGASSS